MSVMTLADVLRRLAGEAAPESTPDESGSCIHCGRETRSMLTTPGKGWRWLCSACYDTRSPKDLPTTTREIDLTISDAQRIIRRLRAAGYALSVVNGELSTCPADLTDEQLAYLSEHEAAIVAELEEK